MKIDGDEKALEASRQFKNGNYKEGSRLEAEFIADVLASGDDHCSCKIPCDIHGNCMACVISHRAVRDHLPTCFWNMVNEIVEDPNGLCDHKKHDRKPKKL